MDAIETMRNCVAHNRRPNKRTIENYDNARPLLDNMLEDYLARWSPVEEMIWDRDARKAVEYELVNAEWDDASMSITFQKEIVKSREELEDYLSGIAKDAFYETVPREDGEWVFECDEFSIVESALLPYEERLAEFFEDE